MKRNSTALFNLSENIPWIAPNGLHEKETQQGKCYYSNTEFNFDINSLKNNRSQFTPDFVDLHINRNKSELVTETVEEIINDSNSSDLSANSSREIDELKKVFFSNFIQILNDSNFEYGYSSSAEQFILKALDSYGIYVREWINEVFIDNFSNEAVLESILRIISHFSYQDMYPQGMTMAIAALSHESIVVKENAIRAFENWENKESLEYLKSISVCDQWLNEYLLQVITYLEDL